MNTQTQHLPNSSALAYTAIYPFWRCVIAAQIKTPSSPQAAEAAKQFAIEAARLAANTHCNNIAVLDVRGLSPITDFFVIATGTSARQMRSVADEIEEMGEPKNFTPIGRNGYEGESWILTDFVDVVIHIFNGEARGYYDLDGLWGDAPRVDWQPTPR
jgi:ribosome-associated protein